ncbi:MAG TPA: hypothetical protein PLT88_12235 [Bacteroidales bacterium]|jgi:hypothetical protein|nr:hypothetical protein [Bacteroidales bacterium]HRW28278.1 hypothetical protein [Bacteroidales bacterium]
MANPNIHCTIALFFLSGLSHLSGQVCGISGSKLNSSSGQVIDHQSLEFEIQYAFEKSVSVWDDNGTLNPLTGDGRKADIASSLFFRMTFGALRNTEIGATVDGEAEEASLGIKWMPCRQGATSLAVAGGMKFGFGETLFHPVSERTSVLSSVSGALLLSQEITTSVSVDINAGYSIPVAGELIPSHGCLNLCFDWGWFLFDGSMQTVLGTGFRSGFGPEEHERFSLLTLYPGFIVTAGRNFEILVAMPHDLYGINHPRSKSVICALTLMMQ